MKRSLLITLILLALGSPAWGFWLYEQGTPDLSSAAAGRAALGQDASTVGHNPAAMTRLEEHELMLGVQPSISKRRFYPYSSTNVAGTYGSNVGGGGRAGSLAYAYAINESWSIGFMAADDLRMKLDYGPSWVGRYYVTDSELSTIRFTPNVAWRINENFSVGGGLDYLGADVLHVAAVNNPEPTLKDGRLKFDDRDMGLGGNLGLLWEIDQDTRLGLTYKSQVRLKFQDNISYSGLGPIMSDLLAYTGLNERAASFDMKLPQSIMFSSYDKVTDSFAILFNLGWQDWSEFSRPDMVVWSDQSMLLTLDRNYRDTWHIALGGQIQAREDLLFSLGFSYDSAPQHSSDRALDMPVDRQLRYATGVMWDMDDHFSLGFAYQFIDAGAAQVCQYRSDFAGRVRGHYEPNYAHFFGFNLLMRL